MKRLSLGAFYKSVEEIVEPVEVAYQGRLRGTFYPVGTTPLVAQVKLSATDPRSREVLSIVADIPPVSMTQEAARSQLRAAQAQRDEWLRKATPPRAERPRR